MALASESSEVQLHLANQGAILDDHFNDNQSDETITGKVDTLDNQVANLECDQNDFIKIDVEGHELQVLKVTEKTIEEFSPVILVEIADRILGREYVNQSYHETLQWLQNRGHSIYKFTENEKLKKITYNSRSNHLAMHFCLHKRAHSTWKYRMRVWAWMYRYTTKYKPLIRFYLGMIGKAILQPKIALVSVRGIIKRAWKK